MASTAPEPLCAGPALPPDRHLDAVLFDSLAGGEFRGELPPAFGVASRLPLRLPRPLPDLPAPLEASERGEVA